MQLTFGTVFPFVVLAVVTAAVAAGLRREARKAGERALARARATVTPQAPSPSNEDCEDAMMTDVWEPIGRQILDAGAQFNRDPLGRDIPHQNLAWGDPGDLDRLDEFRAIWTEKYGKGER